MSITNQSKPNTSVSNSSKIESEVTWNTNTTTWNTETRTWNDMVSTISNVPAQYASTLWSSARFPWTETAPWIDGSPMINVSKPI